jgi:hypothetical protein
MSFSHASPPLATEQLDHHRQKQSPFIGSSAGDVAAQTLSGSLTM